MPTRKLTGKRGESIAAAYLQSKGYSILERNWRFSRAEIDIIARDRDVLVFVEVKTRSGTSYGEPGEFFRPLQKNRILDAAGEYMEQIGHEWEVRFDLVSVILGEHGETVRHFQDVFFPGITDS